MDFVDKLAKNYKDVFYLIFRVVIGILFFMHGYNKFANGMPTTLFLVAGVVELAVGALLVLGLLVRWASFLGAGQMLIAYIIMHVPKGMNPMGNGGELALLFFAAFCVSFIMGNGKWSLQKS